METITENYVSFEVARLLKDKGFDEPTIGTYNIESKNPILVERPIRAIHCEAIISAPTQAMAMKWLREVHHIHVCPEYKTFFQERPKKIYHHWCNKIIGIGRCFLQGIQDLNELDSDYFYYCGCKTYHNTFEEACEEAIKYSLEKLI